MPTWPNERVPFYTPTVLKYLSRSGGPPEGSPEEIGAEIRQEFKALSDEKNLAAVIAAMREPCGVQMTPSARKFIRKYAQEMYALHRSILSLENELDESLQHVGNALQPLVTVLGKEAAGLILATVGDLRKYHSWRAFIKSVGLNLVESSSGIHKETLNNSHFSFRSESEEKFFKLES